MKATKLALAVLVTVFGFSSAGCNGCNLPQEEQDQIVADSILCGVTVTNSILQCTMACKPDPKSTLCKDTCVEAFLADTGAATVCTNGLGANFIDNPKIIEAVNKGYELGVAIYEATKPVGGGFEAPDVLEAPEEVAEPVDTEEPVDE